MIAVIAISLAIIFGALGDVLLSKGMRASGEVSITGVRDIPRVLRMVFTHPLVLLGIGSMAVYFASYLVSLALMDVSVAAPLTALSYVLATGYAAWRLREIVGTARWAGVILITAGAVFIGMSS